MTNGEFYEKKEAIAEQIIIILRDCEKDSTKINNGLWSKLCQQYDEIEEYA